MLNEIWDVTILRYRTSDVTEETMVDLGLTEERRVDLGLTEEKRVEIGRTEKKGVDWRKTAIPPRQVNRP